jgi:peptidoglycan/LPS O-acetylase OafA/YrhL
MSILIILISFFFMVFPDITFDISMEYPGSSLTWESLDQESKVGMRFLIVRPFWDEILFGILGLFCAWGLKKRESWAWKLGVLWSVMMLVAGIALGLSELFIGKWPTVCLVTIVYSIIGVIGLSCLLIVKKEFN